MADFETSQSEHDSFSRYVKARRVFVLGAGFSADAGIPMTGTLLQKAIDKSRAECPGLFERICNQVRSCFGIENAVTLEFDKLPFSEIMTFLHYIELSEHGGGERYCDYGSRENLALRFYLAKTICELTPSPEAISALYRKFAAQLSPGDIVITFNWDCLLENALKAIGKTYSYSGEQDRIAIWKLHGSINWRLGENYWEGKKKELLNWKSFDFAKGMMVKEVYHCDELRRFVNWHPFQPLTSEVRPLLVLPGFGKSEDVRSIAPVWYKISQAFGYNHDVYIIGLGLAKDDFVIRSFFMDSLPYLQQYTGIDGRKVQIINPDPLTKENYGFLVGSSHIDFICEKFSEKHVEQMINRQRAITCEIGLN
ncbi:MAG: hypothetical protein K0R63_387 [Rickettsiales bacterium]|jgi:hypothetical protein|nr:hypothetical protein [Rickettsiales bacterium]